MVVHMRRRYRSLEVKTALMCLSQSIGSKAYLFNNFFVSSALFESLSYSCIYRDKSKMFL